MKKTHSRNQGFYLFELIVALGIAGILMALCLPFYSQYFIQARRLEAAAALSKLAFAMEKYHSQHHTYEEATLSALHFPAFTGKNNYRLIILSTTDTDYELLAKPLGDQAKKDSLCGALTLNSLDEKGVTGSGKVDDCW